MIVPADDADLKFKKVSWLARRPPESLDIQSRRLDMLICRHALVLPSVEEVQTLVRDECPLCQGTTRVAA